ncbi:hypothetical protein L486_07021 [Kwoniella mangroviensis CBS 10435]|uniref:WSC domain-containing protein n=1 Tax=Kwoniella mangroviensis CBS 10435 TaxID=1331196 RepID=A0A1B9IJ84_9TREE|nr:hypothetical protein L486_07021 [Kwoniella mangroviensis CBS 10435]OCF73733.1 hypothetical protein I204_05577 [Kwoniella mangroviensis CBS 8886]
MLAMVLFNSPERRSSPQFAGCINPATFRWLVHGDSYGLLSKQEDNTACLELCGNERFSYSYFLPRTSQCYCSKTESIQPDQIESGCDILGGCNPCQAIVTYLRSSLAFTSCYSLLSGKPFLDFETKTLDSCLSICSTDIYDKEVVGVQSNRGTEGKWSWKCACYSGRNQGAYKEKYKVNCGKESTWRFEVLRENLRIQ